MACIHVRKWLSFLPAAFVVYILLHYLLYAPAIHDVRNFADDPKALNSSPMGPPRPVESNNDPNANEVPLSGIKQTSNNIVSSVGSTSDRSKENDYIVPFAYSEPNYSASKDSSPLFTNNGNRSWNSILSSENPSNPMYTDNVNPDVHLEWFGNEESSPREKSWSPKQKVPESDIPEQPVEPLVDSIPIPAQSNLEPSNPTQDLPDNPTGVNQMISAENSFQDLPNIGTETRVSVSVSNMSEEKSVSVNSGDHRTSKGAGLPSENVAQVSRTLSASRSEEQIKELPKDLKTEPAPSQASVSIGAKVKATIQAKGASKKSRLSKPATSQLLSVDFLKGPSTVGDRYERGFRNPQEELCPNNGRDLRVIIIVTTAPDHEHHRNAIRQTWGHFSMRKDVSIGFLVGSTARSDVQNLIDRENDRYGDIIEANFVDHYGNLTLKTTAMFEWLNLYCSEVHFVLKTDDDMYINVPLLLAFINTKKNEKRAMFGRLAKGWKPVRNKKSKYYIGASTYSRTRYPEFLTGPAYLFTNDVVDDVFTRALNTTFFMLEDVFMTGFVGESLKIKRVGDSHFRNEKISLKDTCKLMYSISIHMVKYEEQFDIYKRTLDGKTKCKTP